MSKLLAGRYELIEKIGEGGMAVVYKARCRLLNRYVAIKNFKTGVYQRCTICRELQERISGCGRAAASEYCQRL